MSIMVRREDLEALDSIFIAIMCKKLWQDESQDAATREKARELKEEWFQLTEPETPPLPGSEAAAQLELRLASLKSRMITFVLPFVGFGPKN
jgi:hypothetical protein